MRVTILYLAAGNSRRFGENKLLYPLDGKAVYRHLLDRLAQIAGRHENWELLVVTQYERILEELAPLVKAGRLQTVFSPDSEKGISYTIRAGIEAAGEAKCRCLCVFCGRSAVPEGRDGGALSGIHGDAEGSTWLRFLRRRERQSGVVFKTLFFRTKRTFRRPRREKGAETALGIGNSVPGRSRVGIKGSGPERGSLLQRHRRLP